MSLKKQAGADPRPVKCLEDLILDDIERRTAIAEVPWEVIDAALAEFVARIEEAKRKAGKPARSVGGDQR